MSDRAADALLAALLDGPFRQLRDDNHIDPHRILVWDQQCEPVIHALPILDLLGQYPCGTGEDAQWSAEDLLAILTSKRDLLRMSQVAHEISDQLADSEPTCGTVVLIINPDRSGPHRWVEVKARVLPH